MKDYWDKEDRTELEDELFSFISLITPDKTKAENEVKKQDSALS
jgi:hypothetical protein